LCLIIVSPLGLHPQSPEILSWEEDIRDFERLDSAILYPDHAVLFAGSSSIRLWSAIAADMAPYPIIQRGYGGAKLSDLVFYAKRILYPHPSRAIVLFVANDIAGNPDDKTPAEVARLFRQLLRIIRERFPEVPVFWIATTPCALRWHVWPEIEKANHLIEEVCQRHENTYFIRTDHVFLNASRQPREELFQPDKLHLNARGYAIWAEIIKKSLDDRLGATQ
jgi:hypothetical protein